MENKKVIIFYSGYMKKRQGGPASYLYNLYSGLKDITSQTTSTSFYLPEDHLSLRFITRGITEKTETPLITFSFITSFKSFLNVVVHNKIFAIFCLFLDNKIIRYYEFRKYKKEISEADIVHIHYVLDYYFLKNIIKKNAVKILTIHTPESITKEISSNGLKSKILDEIAKIEREAIEWADILLYPCKESFENHLEVFPYLKDITKNKIIRYCPTGTEDLKIEKSKDTIRKELKIPKNAFLISYVGRHVEVKGFDILANAVVFLLEKGEKIYFLTAGRGNLIDEFVKNKKLSYFWKHIEWTNNPGDIINASDCFVLANRRSFFDLALIEAMSVGLPIITTNVGGSSFIIKKSNGILSVAPKIIDIMQKIALIKEMALEERLKLGYQNLTTFEKYFGIKSFAKNYINAIKNG